MLRIMRPKMLAVAFAAGLGSYAVTPVQAQSIVAFVNSEPITNYDIEQRMRINRISRQPSGRAAVLNELIDDKVKLAEARRTGYRIQDSNIDDQIQKQAKSNNQTLVEFNQTLNKAGIDMNAYRDKLKANYAWELAMERRRGPQTQDPLFGGGGTGARVIDYTLYSVIFVVPRGTSPGAKTAQANAVRARFNDCNTGLAQLRNMIDVAVRTPVRRTSDSLSPQLNKILAGTPVNRMTAPFPSDQGVETLAVCEKTERFDRSARSAADDKANLDNAAYLKTLRAKAVIRYGGR